MSSQNPTEVSSNDLPQQSSITATDLFEALANDRRQYVIRAVDDEKETIGSLAEQLARVEHDIPADVAVDDTLRKRAYVSLYQNHLEVLDDLGIISWDQDAGSITAGANHEQALRTLRFVTDEDASLSQHVRDVVGGVF